MCWMAVAAVAAVAAAATSAYGAYEQGQTSKKMAEYNNEMAQRQADDAMRTGAMEYGETVEKARRDKARQVAALAAGGADVNSGSALSLLTETEGMGRLDALRVMNNAQRTAWGYQAQGELERYAGKRAAMQGTLSAAGSLLGGVSSAAGYMIKSKSKTD